MLGVPQFEVGHVDVHNAVHPLDTFEAVVRRCVVHERQAQSAVHRDHKRFQNLRNDVLGGDEIDVVAAGLLQVEHDSREFSRRHFCAFTELTRLEILAEHAAQVAPAEKDRA